MNSFTISLLLPVAHGSKKGCYLICPGRLLGAHGPLIVAVSCGILLASGLGAVPALGQEVLYGMNDVGQPGGPDEIVRIDATTGVATRQHIFSTGNNLLESLAYDARENVLWTTNDGVLLRVDPQTFVTAHIGDTDLDDIDGLAVQPSTGVLFGITYGGNDLIRIDKSDAGAVILNGNLEAGSRLEDLAFDSTGRLYVLTSRAIVEVNPSTGQRISKATLSGAASLEGLVWDLNRGTFLSAADRGGFKDLVTINRTTGQVAFVSATLHSGFKDIEALAFLPGTPIVPVELQAAGAFRDLAGATVAWEAREADLTFTVQRALTIDGPWLEIARVRDAESVRSGAWRYAYHDAGAAGIEFADRSLAYRVGAADDDGVWSWLLFEVAALVPSRSQLRANFPNPFNPTTAFEVQLSSAAGVVVEIWDAAGRRVRTVRGDYGPGRHLLVWDGRDAAGRAVAAGVYPYTLRAGNTALTGRAVLIK